jgi:multiple sugar transport system substrate-binding protein
MRKILALAILAILAASPLFGAGQSEAAAASKKIDLLWYIWDDPEKQGHQMIADNFMKENPNYNIEISRTPFSKYEETIRTILAGGDVPNVIQVNDDHVKFYAHSGWLNPLDDFAKDWTIKREDTYTNFWDFNFYEGKMVSVTPGVKVRFHLYNKTLFNEAGLSEPPAKWEDPSWNWDAALAAAKKLTKREGDRTTVWGYSVSHEAAAASAWIDNNIPGRNDQYSEDGLKFMAGTQAGWEAMQWIADLTYVHDVQPPWGINQKGANTMNLWRTGQMALIYTGSWEIPVSRETAEFEWDITSLPMKVEGHTQASLVCYGVPSRADQPMESGFFAAALMDEFSAKTWGQNGFAIPVVREFAEKYYIQPDEEPSRQIMVPNGLEVAFPPMFTVYTSKAKAIWDSSYKLTWSGEKPAREIMLSVKDEIESILAGN